MKELNLPQKARNILDAFTQKLKDIYQNELVSIILYGSAASGEFAYKHSNINLLVVLKNASLENLDKVSGLITVPKFQVLNPLFLTEDYIKSSLDVFPIEFLDIKENYIILYGKDILGGLEIDLKNLRFQCEQELKAKLLNLKNIYLRSKDKFALRVLLFKYFTSITHIMRNLLRLRGKMPSYLKERVLNEVAQEFQINTDNFKKILEAKQKNLRLSYRELESLFTILVKDLEKITDIVDKL
jgi:predicted nucleotidyltransferase